MPVLCLTLLNPLDTRYSITLWIMKALLAQAKKKQKTGTTWTNGFLEDSPAVSHVKVWHSVQPIINLVFSLKVHLSCTQNIFHPQCLSNLCCCAKNKQCTVWYLCYSHVWVQCSCVFVCLNLYIYLVMRTKINHKHLTCTRFVWMFPQLMARLNKQMCSAHGF